MKHDPLRAALLEAQVVAALGGHQLGPFEKVENGYQAVCAACGVSSWVGVEGLHYSLLAEVCPGAKGKED